MARTYKLGAAVVALALLVLGFESPAGAETPPAATAPTSTVQPAPIDPTTLATPEEVEAARKVTEAARADAEAAALAYQEAEAALSQLDARIAELEARIPELVARIKQLKELLAERAAVLYISGEPAGIALFDEVSHTGDLMAGGHVARLADAANADTDDQMDQLDKYKAQLDRDREEVKKARKSQEKLAEEAARRATELTAALAAASANLRVQEAEEGLRRYLAALEAQRGRAAAAAAAAAAGGQAQVAAPTQQKAPADPALAAEIPADQMLCPIAAPVAFSDGFGQPRSNWRVHQGTDIFAARGTPNVAIADGAIKISLNNLGGNALWLYTAGGHGFYYAHLDAFEGEFSPDGYRWVRKGEVIGYTGNTGNAAGGPVHTHFEVHPRQLGPINPYPLLREMCAVELGLRPPPPPPPTTIPLTPPSTVAPTEP